MPIPAWLQALQSTGSVPFNAQDWDGSSRQDSGYWDAASGTMYMPRYTTTPNEDEGEAWWNGTLPATGYTSAQLQPLADGSFAQINGGLANHYDLQGNQVASDKTVPPSLDGLELATMAAIAAMTGGAAMSGLGLLGAGAGVGGGVGGATSAANMFPGVATLEAGGLTSSGIGAMGAAGATPGLTMLPGGGFQFGVLDATVPWGQVAGGAAGGGAAGAAGGGGSAAGGNSFLGGLETASGSNSIANMLPASGSSASGLGSLMSGAKSWLGPAATALGALSGSQGQDQSQASERRTDPRFDPYIFGGEGQSGILQRMQSLLSQQSSPEYQRAYDQQRNVGLGLLNMPLTPRGGLTSRWER